MFKLLALSMYLCCQKQKVHSISHEEARVFAENLKVLNGDVFTSDLTMMCDLIKSPKNIHKNVERIGVTLITSRENCANCRGRLSTRRDRVASAVIYDHAHGTIPAWHYAKYCHKPGCYYNQHYGCHTVDDSSSISYDSDWLELPYFMASRETAFSLAYLRQFDVHCLIGQISYKQAAEKYNCYNGYE